VEEVAVEGLMAGTTQEDWVVVGLAAMRVALLETVPQTQAVVVVEDGRTLRV